MRIWSVHPKYLDAQGLVGLWREGLLAQKVLCGLTRGYKNHPQLIRFRGTEDPVGGIAKYLQSVYAEAAGRGYQFDRDKILPAAQTINVPVTSGQLLYEWEHLKRKLSARSAKWLEQWRSVKTPDAHPLFNVVPGEIETWERVYGT